MKIYHLFLVLTFKVFLIPCSSQAYDIGFVNASDKPVHFMMSDGVRVVRDTSIMYNFPITRKQQITYFDINSAIVFVEVDGKPFPGHGKGNVIYVFTKEHRVVYHRVDELRDENINEMLKHFS